PYKSVIIRTVLRTCRQWAMAKATTKLNAEDRVILFCAAAGIEHAAVGIFARAQQSMAIGSVAGLGGIEGGVGSGGSTSSHPGVERRIGDQAMKSITTKADSSQPVADTAVYLFDDWFEPIEAAVRDRVRGFIQAMIEGELDEKLQRPRYGRRPKSLSSVDDGGIAVSGHRHGHRSRSLTGTFGRIALEVPRARLVGADGKTSEWKS